MIVSESSVTVTVINGEATTTFSLGRVQDFSAETRRDEPPYYRADPLRMSLTPDPPRSITFSMRPLPNDDGEYMRVEIHEVKE